MFLRGPQLMNMAAGFPAAAAVSLYNDTLVGNSWRCLNARFTGDTRSQVLAELPGLNPDSGVLALMRPATDQTVQGEPSEGSVSASNVVLGGLILILGILLLRQHLRHRRVLSERDSQIEGLKGVEEAIAKLTTAETHEEQIAELKLQAAEREPSDYEELIAAEERRIALESEREEQYAAVLRRSEEVQAKVKAARSKYDAERQKLNEGYEGLLEDVKETQGLRAISRTENPELQQEAAFQIRSLTDLEAAVAAITSESSLDLEEVRKALCETLGDTDEQIATEAARTLNQLIWKRPDLANPDVLTAIEATALAPDVPNDVAYFALQTLQHIALVLAAEAHAEEAVRIIYEKGVPHPQDRIAQFATNKLRDIARYSQADTTLGQLMDAGLLTPSEFQGLSAASGGNPSRAFDKLMKRHARLIPAEAVEALRANGFAPGRNPNGWFSTLFTLQNIALLIEETPAAKRAIEVLTQDALEHSDSGISLMSLGLVHEKIAIKKHARITPELVADLIRIGLAEETAQELKRETILALRWIVSPGDAVPNPDATASQQALEALYTVGLSHPDEDIAMLAGKCLIAVAEGRYDIITSELVAAIHAMYLERRNDPIAATLSNVLYRLVRCHRDFFTPELVETLAADLQEDPDNSGYELHALVYLFKQRPELVTPELWESVDTTQLIKRDSWTFHSIVALAGLTETRPELFTPTQVESFYAAGLEHVYRPPARWAEHALMVLAEKRPELIPNYDAINEEDPPSVSFHAGELEQFVEQYGADISERGMLMPINFRATIGSVLSFNIRFDGNLPLLSGKGRIVWIRNSDLANTGLAAGLGIKFLELSPESQTMLARILAAKEQ